jgi:putative FmdB family regulatory protein
MPTYEYRCEDCGETVEVVQSFTDAPLTTCTVCGGRLRKVFAPVGIVFKGSGFYKTDSRTSSSRTGGSSKADGADGSKDGAKDRAKDGSSDGAKATGKDGATTAKDGATASTGSSGTSGSKASPAASTPAKGAG